MSLRIHHIALRARDTSRTERFYVSVLGLEVRRRDPERGSVWLRAGDVVLMIERMEAGEPAPADGSMDLVAFAVNDREAWRARLAEAGVSVEAETPNTLYFRDPDGRRVGVSVYAFD
jgi:catechol 2,3-dioxygenase-like lactoylglutathione lyase family enzyme